MKNKEEFPEILTLPELARYLRVTRQTIYNLLWKKKIPALRVGRYWRFRKSDIDKWLSEQAVKRTRKKKSGE
ncbi:DNA-binding protein [Candidatus Bathyarchaeota archaeon]|nr:MAG: DNA-binding protein [Candidatus Bathyarchaeota archaeon]